MGLLSMVTSTGELLFGKEEAGADNPYPLNKVAVNAAKRVTLRAIGKNDNC